jgi:hypothetical protein
VPNETLAVGVSVGVEAPDRVCVPVFVLEKLKVAVTLGDAETLRENEGLGLGEGEALELTEALALVLGVPLRLALALPLELTVALPLELKLDEAVNDAERERLVLVL